MLNFEDIEYEEITDYQKLYYYIKERLLPDQMNYIFLDEIQHVADFEKAVDSLFIKENCDEMCIRDRYTCLPLKFQHWILSFSLL